MFHLLSKSKSDWRIKPGVLTTVFGDPITNEDYANLSVEELQKLVKKKISELIKTKL